MGNTCTSASYDVAEAKVPAPLPGSEADVKALTDCVTVHLPGTAEYEFNRKDKTWLLDPSIWGRPSAIAVPKNAEQVAAIVKFAAATRVKLSIACGRHTYESIVQDALMVDMSHGMNEVTVDPETKIVRVQGGATIGKVDQTCAPHGVIIPLGRIGTTGCGGQIVTTGAHGYGERMFGLGVDYLIAATVVIGTGEIITCSATENEELFWAIRGGGSNFGIVCEMVFNPYVAPNAGKFYAGTYVYLTVGALGFPTRQQVMDHVVECMDSDRHPREYGFSGIFLGGSINPVIVNHFWFGDSHDAGKEYFKKEGKKIAFCVANTMGVHDYWTGIQKWAQGPKGDQVGPGAYYYRGVMPQKFTAEMGKAIVDACKGPFPKGIQPIVLCDLMGGKALDVPQGSMALPHRTKYWIVITCEWKPELTGPAGRDFSANWVRSLWKALIDIDRHQSGEAASSVDMESHSYLALEKPAATEENTMTMGQQAQVRSIWGANEARMQAAKRQFDPKGVFTTNIPGV